MFDQVGVRTLSGRLAVLLALATLAGAAQADVPALAWVQAKRIGGGFLFSRLNACYLVTPGHVLEGWTSASLRGSGPRELLGRGELVALDSDADIALLRVSGQLAERCGLDYVSGIEDARLVMSTSGLLSAADAGGGIERDQVDIIDVGSEFLQIRAARGERSLSEGQSGSLLVIDGSPAGMLLKVHNGDDWKQGVATVRRYDDIWPRVRRMLDSAALMAPGRPPVPELNGANLADEARGARMVYWSAQPANPQWHVGHLLGKECAAHWEAVLSARPIDLDMELAGQRVQPISRVEVRRCVDLGLPPPEGLELFVSADRLSWSSVGAGAFDASGAFARWEFAPRRARFLRLRINGQAEGARTIALSKIVVN